MSIFTVGPDEPLENEPLVDLSFSTTIPSGCYFWPYTPPNKSINQNKLSAFMVDFTHQVFEKKDNNSEMPHGGALTNGTMDFRETDPNFEEEDLTTPPPKSPPPRWQNAKNFPHTVREFSKKWQLHNLKPVIKADEMFFHEDRIIHDQIRKRILDTSCMERTLGYIQAEMRAQDKKEEEERMALKRGPKHTKDMRPRKKVKYS